MANFVTKKVAKHVLQENAANRFGTDDPYFEHVAAVDLDGKATGKYTKRKRAVPPGLTKQEEKVLKKVTRRAYRLDNCLNICGIRVGWGAIIGLLPAIGDIVDAMMAFMVVWTATRVDIPSSLKSRMMMNIALDFVVGLVPFLGDVADAFFRCNTRNAALLWKHLQARGAERLRNQESTSINKQTTGSRTEPLPDAPKDSSMPQPGSKNSQKIGRFDERHGQPGSYQSAKVDYQHLRSSSKRRLDHIQDRDLINNLGEGSQNV